MRLLSIAAALLGGLIFATEAHACVGAPAPRGRPDFYSEQLVRKLQTVDTVFYARLASVEGNVADLEAAVVDLELERDLTGNAPETFRLGNSYFSDCVEPGFSNDDDAKVGDHVLVLMNRGWSSEPWRIFVVDADTPYAGHILRLWRQVTGRPD